MRGKLPGKFFRSLAARGKKQDRSQILGQSTRHQARPAVSEPRGVKSGQGFQVHLLEGYGPFEVLDENRVPADPLQPFHDGPRICHASAQEQKLGVDRGEGDRQFIVRTADGIPEHLVFVHSKKARTGSCQEPAFLCFEGGNQPGRLQPESDIAGADPGVESALGPLGELVIGEGPRGYGKHRLPFKRIGVEFKNVGFACSGGGMNHHVLPASKSVDGFLLPEIRQEQVLEKRVNDSYPCRRSGQSSSRQRGGS